MSAITEIDRRQELLDWIRTEFRKHFLCGVAISEGRVNEIIDRGDSATMTLAEANRDLRNKITYRYTCRDYVRIAGQTKDKLWVVHHYSHSEYINRFSGSTNCGSWWGIWDGRGYDHMKVMIEDNMLTYYSGRGAKRKLQNEFGGWENE
jgi:hypothetical protein